MANVIVVGAGVSGLSSAYRLLESGHSVRIIADRFTPDTTSDVSAAMWWPFHASPADKVLKWCTATYDEFARLSKDGETGVVMRAGVFGFGDIVPDWANHVPSAVPAPSDQLPPGCANGLAVLAPMIEMDRYMPWLFDRVQKLGATVARSLVASLPDLAGGADVVINATGLGARELANDPTVYPARGRVVKFEQAGIDEFVGNEAGEWPMHVFPRRNDVVVGGSYEENIEDLEVAPQMDDAIVARAVAAQPLLRNARRIGAVTGLRPCRPEVRLEREGNIIHNYGHGGGGVTLSWGCADDVARLAGS